MIFLSDATATYDYADRGCGAMSNEEVHRATLTIMQGGTARVMSVAELEAQLAPAKAQSYA